MTGKLESVSDAMAFNFSLHLTLWHLNFCLYLTLWHLNFSLHLTLWHLNFSLYLTLWHLNCSFYMTLWYSNVSLYLTLLQTKKKKKSKQTNSNKQKHYVSEPGFLYASNTNTAQLTKYRSFVSVVKEDSYINLEALLWREFVKSDISLQPWSW